METEVKNDIAYVLVSEKQIDEITTRIAAEIDRDYADSGKKLLLLCQNHPAAGAPAAEKEEHARQGKPGGKNAKCRKKSNNDPPSHRTTPKQFMQRGLGLFVFYYISREKGSA